MSGIAGIVELDGKPASVQVLGQMTSVLSHRGPDAVLHWNDGPVALGHCMLRTTPESLSEVQPLRDQLGDVVITFDGRLDNRDELRLLLLSKGFIAQTDTDAELVLKAYRCWDDSCPEKLLGDFAFAIWDGPRSLSHRLAGVPRSAHV